MKGSTWRRLVREHLLPYLGDWQLAGSIHVFGRVEWILHGVALDTSGFSATRITVWIFSQPLYVPSQNNSADYGEQLRQAKTGLKWWDIEPGEEARHLHDMLGAIREQALPFYARTATPEDLATYSEKRYKGSVNPPIIEAEAYSWALAGEDRKALEVLERLKRAVDAMPSNQPWGRPILERSLLVRQALTEGVPAVLGLLRGWRDETVRDLRLEGLTEPWP